MLNFIYFLTPHKLFMEHKYGLKIFKGEVSYPLIYFVSPNFIRSVFYLFPKRYPLWSTRNIQVGSKLNLMEGEGDRLGLIYATMTAMQFCV